MVILAGGLATRLGPLAAERPKSMLEIEGKPFLQYQFELLKQHNITDIVLCLGHLGHIIEAYFGDGKRFGLNIRYSKESGRLLGTGGGLRKALPLLNESFFVMYGDSYLMLDYGAIEREFLHQPESGLMVVYRNENRYDRSNLVIENGRVIEYGPENHLEKHYIDEGISVLRRDFFEPFHEAEVFGLPLVFQKLIAARKLRAMETGQRFYEIGSFAGVEEFRNWIKQKG